MVLSNFCFADVQGYDCNHVTVVRPRMDYGITGLEPACGITGKLEPPYGITG